MQGRCRDRHDQISTFAPSALRTTILPFPCLTSSSDRHSEKYEFPSEHASLQTITAQERLNQLASNPVRAVLVTNRQMDGLNSPNNEQ